MPSPGHNIRIPDGRQLARLLQKLWKEQEAYLLNLIKTQGPHGLYFANLSQWEAPLRERSEPLMEEYAHEGAARLERKVSRVKSYRPSIRKELVNISTLPGWESIFGEDEETEDEWGVFNPRVSQFVRENSYLFAQSTNNTTKLRLDTAYNRFREGLATGLEQGETLYTLTRDIQKIFRNPTRAFAIGATESSRAFHQGQEIAAKETGMIWGMEWLASSDACEICLGLNGKRVKLGEPFIVLPGGGPYAVVTGPPAHPHCQCSETEVFNEEVD